MEDAASTTNDPAIDEDLSDQFTWQEYVPGVILIVPMAIAFLLKGFSPNGMINWAVSRNSIGSGELLTIQSHMFAHGSIMHITMNCASLYAIAPVLFQRLGSGFRAAILLFVLFELSGLGGLGTFLAIHQWNDTPMLGASGAIYGLVGFLVRYPQAGGPIVPIFSKDMLNVATELIKDHVWLFVLIALPPLLLGNGGGLAWEAHLGGFIAGLLLCPLCVKYAKVI